MRRAHLHVLVNAAALIVAKLRNKCRTVARSLASLEAMRCETCTDTKPREHLAQRADGTSIDRHCRYADATRTHAPHRHRTGNALAYAGPARTTRVERAHAEAVPAHG